MSVNAIPTLNAMPATLCANSITTLTATPAGGVWSLSSSLVASIVGSTGVITASGTYTGVTTVSYSLGACPATHIVTVVANPGGIQGASSECAGVTIILSDATAGGTWTGTSGLTVSGTGTSSGTVTAGAVAGTGTVTYTAPTGCFVTYPNTTYANPAAITGTFTVCAGSVTVLTDATSGALGWTSSNTTIATVTAGGSVTGVASGVATITYKITTGSCIATQIVTVDAVPVVATIQGTVSISHTGGAVTLSDATAGGLWTSSNTSVITLTGTSSTTVTATAVASTGSSVLSYAVTNGFGCKTTVTKTNIWPSDSSRY